MSLWAAGRGADLILKDEWRPKQRSLSFFSPPPPPPPGPPPPPPPGGARGGPADWAGNAPPAAFSLFFLSPPPRPRAPLHPYPASLPRVYTYICMRKAPGSSPIWGGEAEGFLSLSVTALSQTLSANAQAAVMPWVLRSGGTPVRVRAVQCRARVRCRGLRTGETHPRARRAGSAAWRLRRA